MLSTCFTFPPLTIKKNSFNKIGWCKRSNLVLLFLFVSPFHVFPTFLQFPRCFLHSFGCLLSQRGSDWLMWCSIRWEYLSFQVEDTDIVPEVVCIVQISRIDVQVTEPMYPTELTKLTVANAEYPAGKAMLMCTYSDVSAQVCNFSTNSNKFICKILLLILSKKFTSKASLFF